MSVHSFNDYDWWFYFRKAAFSSRIIVKIAVFISFTFQEAQSSGEKWKSDELTTIIKWRQAIALSITNSKHENDFLALCNTVVDLSCIFNGDQREVQVVESPTVRTISTITVPRGNQLKYNKCSLISRWPKVAPVRGDLRGNSDHMTDYS